MGASLLALAKYIYYGHQWVKKKLAIFTSHRINKGFLQENV